MSRRLVHVATAAALMLGSLVMMPSSGVSAAPAPAADQLVTGEAPMMLVVDVSGSMRDKDKAGTVKIEGAKTGILELLNQLPYTTRIGLRTYPDSGASCGDGKRAFAVTQRDPAEMSARIRALKSDGGTPTAEALRAAGQDLKAAGHDTATIILVSDGESTCDPPCPVAQELAAMGLTVTVRAVGFLIDSAGADEMQCLAVATHGSYTDVSDAAGLAAELTGLGAPKLEVAVDVAATYNSTTQAVLPLTATITNDSDVQARDVRATLSFDPVAAGGALVTSPVRVLGNAAPGGKLRASWTAMPSRAVTSGELSYTLVVTSRGGAPVRLTGTVRIADRLGLKDAGDLLRSAKQVVVLGDSYSSGEGAGGYDDTAGKCNRSPLTYASQLFTADDVTVTNLACSGAIVRDHTGNQLHRDMNGAPWPTQQQQLAALSEKPDLVLLTMGGNDINFESIILNCVIGLGCNGAATASACSTLPPAYQALCNERVVKPALRANPAMWTAQLASLRPTLADYYKRVLGDVGDAPVVVLPYVEVVPNTARGLAACMGALPAFGPHEFELIRWLQAELNNQIAAAVRDVRAQGYAARLHFASDVATALQPGHTLCAQDDQRWVVGLLAGSKQEKVHPTAAGYRAIAAALVRWSTRLDPPSVTESQPLPPGWLERAGRAVVDGVDATVDWVGDRARDAGRALLSSPSLRIFAGRPVQVQAGGFLPGESVVVGVGSTLQTLAVVTADDEGAVSATVELPPDLRPGDHILFAAGFAEGGDYRVEWAPAEVVGPGLAGPLSVTALGILLAAAGVLVLRRARRRPGTPS